jgi:ribosomal protein S18 acetylase RimI-like enzyme
VTDPTPLDNPAFTALLGPQAYLAEHCGNALRYPADVAPFCGLPAEPSPDDWHGLATLVGSGGVAVTAGMPAEPPPGWRLLRVIDGVQLTGEHVTGEQAADASTLGPADVPEMVDLVRRTEPGPFLPRTIEFGGYLGIRRNGVLVAMAGQRLRPPGWTEISAVCTDPSARGQGLATRLTLAVVADIRARGDAAFLHATATNVTAVRLYESLGFQFRRTAPFTVLRAPS